MSYIKFVKRNIRRAPYQALTASMVMFLTFLVVSVFLLIALGSQKILQYYESKPQAIAFFKDGTTDSDINLIKESLVATGKVTNLKYISKQEPVVEEVVYPEDVVESLNKATEIIRFVGLVLISFLATFATLVILMVIGFKIRLRRSEIETMKLLGASNWFIRMPFLLEGMFYGVVGAVFAWISSLVLLWYFAPFIERNMAEVKLLSISPIVFLGLFLVELLLALIIGFFGSYAAVRRYLRI